MRGKTSKRTGSLSFAERKNLESSIERDQELLERVTGTPRGEGEWHMPATEVIEMDTEAIKARIARNKKALMSLSPQPSTGAEKARLEVRAKHLEEWLAPRMLTKAELDYFPARPGDIDAGVKESNYRKAVDHAMHGEGEHSNVFIQNVQEWKGIMRSIHPDDPEASSLERIRPQGDYSSGRHFNV